MAFFSNKFCKKSLCFEILKVSWRELTNKKVVRLRVVMWGQCSASSGIRYDVSRAAVVEFADPDYQPGGSPRGRPSESSPGMPEFGGQCSASSGIRYDVSRAAVVEFADPDYQPGGPLGGCPRGRPSESSPTGRRRRTRSSTTYSEFDDVLGVRRRTRSSTTYSKFDDVLEVRRRTRSSTTYSKFDDVLVAKALVRFVLDVERPSKDQPHSAFG